MTWSDIAELYSSKVSRRIGGWLRSDRFSIARFVSVTGSVGVDIVFYDSRGKVATDVLSSGFADEETAYREALSNLVRRTKVIAESVAANDPISWEDVYYLDYEWPDLTFSSKEELELKLSVVV